MGFVSGFAFTRFDFTKEKRFTISKVSQQILGRVHEPMKVIVYLKGDNFPGWAKRLQRATRDMLSDLQAYSHGNLTYEFVDPIAEYQRLIRHRSTARYMIRWTRKA